MKTLYNIVPVAGIALCIWLWRRDGNAVYLALPAAILLAGLVLWWRGMSGRD